MLMIAHVVYPELDPSGTPATLSRPIATDLLRGELGFRGALVTDALDMYAIAHNFDPGEAAVAAITAGIDLLLTDRFDLVHEALQRAASDGRLPEARLREASGRAREAKAYAFGTGIGRLEPADPDAADQRVRIAAHEEVADRIAAAATTLVDGALFPPTARPLLLATHMTGWPRIAVEPRLRDALAVVGWNDVELLMLDPAPDAEAIQEAVGRARAAGWTALLHFNGVMSYDPSAVAASGTLVALAGALADAEIPITVVSLGSPYVLSRFERAVALLCSYSVCAASVRAVLRVLRGEVAAPGQLPVRLEGVRTVGQP